MTGVIIIGGGAAGLSAALAAREQGEGVLLLEKNDRPGRKLLLAGGGRCNLMGPGQDGPRALSGFGREGKFLRDALGRFSLDEFLASVGIEREQDPKDGHWYVRGGSKRMLSALMDNLGRAGVEVRTGTHVTGLHRTESGWRIETTGDECEAARVVVATGGITYPGTGSCGEGYAWAAGLGHGIDEPRGTLGGLVTEPAFERLAGVTITDAALTLRVGERKAGGERGTLLFTHEGLSGPAAVDLSIDVTRAMEGSQEELIIDLLPGVDRERLERGLRDARGLRAPKAVERVVGKALAARVVEDLLRRSGVQLSQTMSQVSHRNLLTLVEAMKATKVMVKGVSDPQLGMVTLGGISTREIEPRTMESRRARGVHFAGEVLSPAGKCGGYNLLAAFATGWSAGGRGAVRWKG